MKVLLINPSLPRGEGRFNFYPPTSLAFIASQIKALDCEVKVIDINAVHKPRNLNQVIAEAREFEPDAIGLSILTPVAHYAYKVIDALRPLSVPIFVGGIHPTLCPEEALVRGADFVVKGEGEATVAELLHHFRGERSPESILGLSFKTSDGSIVHNRPRPLINDLDTLPFPDRSFFDYDAYVQEKKDVGNFGIMVSSRGCFGKCTYCSRFDIGSGKVYRFRSPANTLLEMQYLWHKYKVPIIMIQDDVFTVHKKRVQELCELIINEKGFHPVWECQTRADCIDKELLRIMNEAGCHLIYYGFESGDAETLERVKKNVSLERMIEAAEWTHEAGIKVNSNFMIGFPWETDKHLANTFRTIERVRPFTYRFSIWGLVKPYPGSEIYRCYHEEFGFTDWWLKKEFLPKENPPLFQSAELAGIGPQEELLEINFFKYTATQKRAIRRFFRTTGRNEYNIYRKFPRREVFFGLYYLSRLLYSISPFLESKVAFPLYRALHKSWVKLNHIFNRNRQIQMG